MTATINESGCRVFDLSSRNDVPIEIKKTEKKIYSQSLIAKTITDEKELISHAADAIVSRDRINSIVLEGFMKKDYAKITAFIFGCNTGFRVSDILNIKVSDIMIGEKIIDWYAVHEQKTDKPRKVYLNDTVKKALEFLIMIKNKNENDYLFCADKRPDKWSYVDLNNPKYLATKDFDKARVKEKLNPDGTERVQAPMRYNDYATYLMKIAKQAGLDEHCSSHCMRQTYGWHFRHVTSQFEIEHPEYKDRPEDIALLSFDFGHSSISLTEKYYAKISPLIVKGRQLELNLGAEALDMVIESYKNGERK